MGIKWKGRGALALRLYPLSRTSLQVVRAHALQVVDVAHRLVVVRAVDPELVDPERDVVLEGHHREFEIHRVVPEVERVAHRVHRDHVVVVRVVGRGGPLLRHELVLVLDQQVRAVRAGRAAVVDHHDAERVLLVPVPVADHRRAVHELRGQVLGDLRQSVVRAPTEECEDRERCDAEDSLSIFHGAPCSSSLG